MQSYNFEVLFKSQNHVDLFKEENSHVTRRIKHFQHLERDKSKNDYLVSFVSKRTEKSVKETFNNYATSVTISSIDLRVKHGKKKKENQKNYYCSSSKSQDSCTSVEIKTKEESQMSAQNMKIEENAVKEEADFGF